MTTTRKVDYAEYATRIVRATPEGAPLTTQAHGTLDAMTIGWGALGTKMRARFYPADVDGSACGSNRDPHLMVFGRVVGAYVAEA